MSEEQEKSRRPEIKWRGKGLLAMAESDEPEENADEEPEHQLFDSRTLSRAISLAGDDAKHALGLMRVSGSGRKLHGWLVGLRALGRVDLQGAASPTG